MNEYLLYAAIGGGILLLCLIVPGLKVIAELAVKGLAELIVGLLKHKGLFVVYVVKTLWRDHQIVLKHATQPANVIDPTQDVRAAAGE